MVWHVDWMMDQDWSAVKDWARKINRQKPDLLQQLGSESLNKVSFLKWTCDLKSED